MGSPYANPFASPTAPYGTVVNGQAPSLVCPTRACPTLPSSETAYMVAKGQPGGWPRLIRDVIVRGALIGGGMYVAGARENVLRYALGGAIAIEVFAVGWVATQTKEI